LVIIRNINFFIKKDPLAMTQCMTFYEVIKKEKMENQSRGHLKRGYWQRGSSALIKEMASCPDSSSGQDAH